MREASLRKGALRSVPVPALYCRSTKQAGHVTGRAGRATFPQNTGDIAMQNVRRHLILYKGDELFIYGYDPGQERRVLETLIAQAKDERTDLDWFDVGVLEQKLKESVREDAQDPQPGGAAPEPPQMHNRFEQHVDGPLWFMRGLFGPDGDRHRSP
jgi:hypothetical protein